MAVKKATVDSTMAKVEAAAKAAEKKEAPAKKAPAKKATTTKAAATKTAEKKEAPAKAAEKAPAKKAPAKKAPAKKAATKKAAEVKVIVEYAGGQMDTADITSMTLDKLAKAPKSLNVYYQPETNMVYYTADGEEGSFSL